MRWLLKVTIQASSSACSSSIYKVNLAAERHLVELLQDGPVKPLTDTVGLRMVGFGPGVLNVVQLQIGSVFMVLRLAAVFHPAIRQDTQTPMPRLVKNGSTRSLSKSAARFNKPNLCLITFC
ncbi:hypothetical protein NTGZN8_90001 [Candidatus Nitrotoga fabula]|uniref:Uncharacterized protein n=1 Tax=Candidatus Nitrotoga fabula TaxID=2182327 RepID=A0A916BDW5_9PROT|nr:hypothetical protein NTGZN8_90001 [Candidatus Nitrotoga fabula]